MTVTTTTRSEIRERYTWEQRKAGYTCKSPTYLTVPVYVETVANNDTATRPLPGTSLILNPTAQAVQYTKGRGLCSAKSFAWDPYPYCMRTNFVYNCFDTPGYLLAVGVVEDPSWALDARLKIKDLSQNLGASVFEFRETASMFAAAGKAVTKAWKTYRDVRRLRFKGRFTPCSIAAAELTASFGINPLLGELYDGIQTLNTALGKPLLRRVVVTKSSESADVLTSPFANNGYNIQQCTGAIAYSAKRSCRAILYIRLVPDAADFTMGNPLEVAWELVPFSWLADGLIDVGGYLSSLDALKDVQSVTGTVTWKTSVTASSRFAWSSYTTPGLTGRSRYVSHSREIATGIPMPAFPRWTPSRSWRKIMHAVSALTVINSRCKKANWSFPFAPSTNFRGS